jgi:hypothetical protein
VAAEAPTKTFYISGIGSDNNSGLSSNAPLASCAGLTAKLATNPLNGGDSVLFDAANPVTMNNPTPTIACNINGPLAWSSLGSQNVTTNSTSALLPITISSYGGTGSCNPIAGQTGTCGKINVTGTISQSVWMGIVSVSNVNYAIVENLIVTNTVALPAPGNGWGTASQPHTAGILLSANGSQNTYSVSNYTITNNAVSEFTVGIEVSENFAGSWGVVCGGGKITNNLVYGVAAASYAADGIFLYGAGKYCSTPQTMIQGNLVYNIGGGTNLAAEPGSLASGIILGAGTNGVLDQFNVTHDIGGNNQNCGGPVGNWVYDNNNGASTYGDIFQYNETYNVKPTGAALTAAPSNGACDWAGYDLDTSVINSIIQYNYSHDNYGAGILLYTGLDGGNNKWTNNYIRFNVSYNDAWGNEAPLTNSYNASNPVYYVYNNTFYNPTGTQAALSGGAPVGIYSIALYGCPGSGSVIANNIFAMAPCTGCGGANFVNFATISQPGCNNARWAANDWYSVGAGRGPLWIYSNNQVCNTLACWQTNINNGDAGATQATPFTAAATDITCYPANTIPNGPQPPPTGTCPAWAGSTNVTNTMKGTGVNVYVAPYGVPTTKYPAATVDYYGNSVPNTTGSGYNIGAYGGN